MSIEQWFWPSEDMDFWKIENEKYKVTISWSHKYFEDYKKLSYQFFECGYRTFCEVIRSGHDNVKSDMWFLVGIFLIRQSIELGLKALLCRTTDKTNEIQKAFEDCCHDLSALFVQYETTGKEEYLVEEEKNG